MTDSFDRALRAAARRGRPVDVCPDAGLLAAYVDRALAADERFAIDAHAADCSACQQHLALLGAVSVEPAEPVAASSWLVRWGWLVPVATAVLVVAVWTRLPDPQERPASVQPPRAAPESRANADVVLSAPADAAKGEALPEVRQKQKLATPAEGNAANKPAAEREASSFAASRVDELRQEAKADTAQPLEPGQRRAVPQAAAPAAPPAPQAKAASEPAAPGREQQLADRARVAETAGNLSRDAASAAGTPPAALKKESAAPAVVFASATERYRAAGHRIEQSEDGATWREVFADPSLTFGAAACSPDGTCWFGTTTGRLQRRAGGSFVAAQLPERRPIVAIAPEAGGIAVVTIDDGRRFRTADHGATWQPVQ